MPYCDDLDGYGQYYPRYDGEYEPYYEDRVPIPCDWDGKKTWVSLVHNKKDPSTFVAFVRAFSWGNEKAHSIVFINGVCNENLNEGQEIFVRFHLLKKLDSAGKRMYNALPVEECDETREVWVQDPNDLENFYLVKTKVDWQGRVKEGAIQELLGTRPRVTEQVLESTLFEGNIDWGSMTVDTRTSKTVLVSTMVQAPNGSWQLETVEESRTTEQVESITELRFEDDTWPMDDLYPDPNSDRRVKIRVVTPNGEFTYDDGGIHRDIPWSELTKSAKEMLEGQYPLCQGCRRVRHPIDKPHCEGEPEPASQESIAALAAHLGGKL